MKIRRVSTRIEHFELSRPYTIAFRTVDSVRNGIVPDSRLMAERVGARLRLAGAVRDRRDLGDVRRGARRAGPAMARRVVRSTSSARALPGASGAPPRCAGRARRRRYRAARSLGAAARRTARRRPRPRPTRRCRPSITIGNQGRRRHGSGGGRVPPARVQGAQGHAWTLPPRRRRASPSASRLHRRGESRSGWIRTRATPADEVTRFIEETAGLAIEFLEQPDGRRRRGGRCAPSPKRSGIGSRADEDPPRRVRRPRAGAAAARLRDLQHQADEVRRGPRREAHRHDRRDRRRRSHVGLHGRERREHLRRAPRRFSPPRRHATVDLDGSLDLARDVAEGGFVIEDGVMRTLDQAGPRRDPERLRLRCPVPPGEEIVIVVDDDNRPVAELPRRRVRDEKPAPTVRPASSSSTAGEGCSCSAAPWSRTSIPASTTSRRAAWSRPGESYEQCAEARGGGGARHPRHGPRPEIRLLLRRRTQPLLRSSLRLRA